MKTDIYSLITQQIIAAIEAGAERYEMPWHTTSNTPSNAKTGKAYRGVNVISLWASASNARYSSHLWATYKQWNELGAQVKRGEKATFIVFWKLLEVDQAEGEETSRPMLAKASFVFNADQVEGFTPPLLPHNPESRIEEAEQFFTSLGATIHHGGNNAFYRPAMDIIQMPEFSQFKEATGYYSTLAHEVTHWTGHASRCTRELNNRFGSEAYAAEELIAELGAAFLCAELGLSNEPRTDHASYIACWLKLLKNDKRAIFTAASKAQQAAQWLKEQTIKQ